jgi:hypothetical protein
MQIQLAERLDSDIQLVISRFADQGMEVKDAMVFEDGEIKPSWLDSKGEPIAGIYHGIPNNLYHQIKGVSSSMLKTMILGTAAHFEKQYVLKKTKINEDDVKDKRPEHFLIGDLVHALMLEPWETYGRYYRLPTEEESAGCVKTATDIEAELKRHGQPKSKAGEKKADKAKRLEELGLGYVIHDIELAKLAEANEGKEGIKGELWDDAHTVYGKFLEREEAQVWIDHEYGLPELSIIVFDEDLDVWLRIRPDFLRVLPVMDGEAYPPMMTDVKTANSANPDTFQNDMGKFGYDIQQAFYEMVFTMFTGLELTGFNFLTAEYRNASIVEPYELEEESIAPARKYIRPQLSRLMKCFKTGKWNGYTEGGVKELRLRPFELQKRSNGLKADQV